MVCSFLTNDRIYKYISNIGNKLTACSIAIGWENIYYLTPYIKITKKENIDENNIDELLSREKRDIAITFVCLFVSRISHKLLLGF